MRNTGPEIREQRSGSQGLGELKVRGSKFNVAKHRPTHHSPPHSELFLISPPEWGAIFRHSVWIDLRSRSPCGRRRYWFLDWDLCSHEEYSHRRKSPKTGRVFPLYSGTKSRMPKGEANDTSAGPTKTIRLVQSYASALTSRWK